MQLSKDQRILWGEVENALEPIAELEKKIQATQYLMGCLLIDILLCEIKLERINSLSSQALLKNLLKRKDMIMDSDIFLAGLYLDPRINCKGSLMMTIQQREIALVSRVNNSY